MKIQLNRVWKFFILLFVNVVIIVSLFYGFEYYLRLTDPFLRLPFDTHYYEGRRQYYTNLEIPPAGEYTWGNLVINNRFGFRERDFEAPKPAGVCRIMVLGDSLTWGAGLAAEERYTGQVETYLNDAFPDHVFEVLNFGVSGAPTIVERDILRDYKDLVNPDLIVIGFVYNDTQPRSQGYRLEKEEFDKKYGHLLGLVPQGLSQVGLFKLAEIIRKAMDNFLVKSGIIPPWEVGVQRTYETDSTEWQEFRQALQDIMAMSDEMDLPPPIFSVLNGDIYLEYPTSVENLAESLPIYLRWYHQAEQTAAEVGFSAYNHEQALIEQLTPDEIEVNELDAHPSAQVNVIYAQKLFQVIASYVEEGKLCAPASPQMPQPALDEALASKRFMRVRLGDNIRFLGYVVNNNPSMGLEETLKLTFGWQALDEIETSYAIQTYLLSSDGERWAEQQTWPCHGDCPTVQWPPGMIAPPGSSTIYWPSSVEMVMLPSERIFKQTHLAYRDGRKETIAIVPLPLTIIPFPGSLIDEHEIKPGQLPAGEYTLVMKLVKPTSGEPLPAYDEVAQRWLPEAGVVLGKVVVP